MNEIELQEMFEKLLHLSSQPDAKVYGTGLWEVCHSLADAGYPPAKDFFVERLENSRWDWRRASVSLLGFHYKLEADILNKVRYLLIHDPDSGVRIAAASVLGVQSKLPEKSLTEALEHDSNEFVKKAAFSALLELAGVPYKVQRSELKKVQSGEVKPTLGQVIRILVDEDLFSSLSLLS
jgi:hypothetical protein